MTSRINAVRPHHFTAPRTAVRYAIMALVSWLWSAPSLAEPTSNGGQAYLDECIAAEVPLPPDWGSSSWSYSGELEVAFIGGQTTGHVYYYTSSQPKGVCMALPRVDASGSVVLLGIICQGESGKACFWDNSTFTLPSISTPKPISQFTGGADLLGQSGGPCTSCHAGENVFIVHPETALDLTQYGIDMKPIEYVSPLVAAQWPQNERPNSVHGECSNCHNQFSAGRLPELSQGLLFCDPVLANAPRTMPPAGTTATTAHYEHWSSMVVDACDGPAPAREAMSAPKYRPGNGWAIISTLVN